MHTRIEGVKSKMISTTNPSFPRRREPNYTVANLDPRLRGDDGDGERV
jgi:hypothetical protein